MPEGPKLDEQPINDYLPSVDESTTITADIPADIPTDVPAQPSPPSNEYLPAAPQADIPSNDYLPPVLSDADEPETTSNDI